MTINERIESVRLREERVKLELGKARTAALVASNVDTQVLRSIPRYRDIASHIDALMALAKEER